VRVVDASVLAPAVYGQGASGQRFRDRLRGEEVAGPDLLRVEVLSVIRRHLSTGLLSTPQADAAVQDLADLPVRVFPTARLLGRVWELRDNVTAYDGCYVALAEALGVRLLTTDRRLTTAPGPRCTVELL
jgi:predicted nucleic acid-binding protein